MTAGRYIELCLQFIHRTSGNMQEVIEFFVGFPAIAFCNIGRDGDSGSLHLAGKAVGFV